MTEHNPNNYPADQLASMSAEAFLTYLRVKFQKTADGKILVPGHGIDCSKMGLTRLPDLSSVTITGTAAGFWCHENELVSLEGLPKGISFFLNCSKNKITSFQNLPLETSHITARFNPIETFQDLEPDNIGAVITLDIQQYTLLKNECAAHGTTVFPAGVIDHKENSVAVDTQDLALFIEASKPFREQKMQAHQNQEQRRRAEREEQDHQHTLTLLAKSPTPKLKFRP